MPLFFCRWQNGMFSVIDVPEESVTVFEHAAKSDGMTFLPMPPCRFDFRWNESGQIELVKVAPHTASFISRHYDELKATDRTSTNKADKA